MNAKELLLAAKNLDATEVEQLTLSLLIRHEGVRNKRYKCPAGKWTIGVGHSGRHVPKSNTTVWKSEKIIEVALEDIKTARQDAGAFLGLAYEELSDSRKIALLNLAFNLGRMTLFSFSKFRTALLNKDYRKASVELIDSLYSGPPPRGVGMRAFELAAIIRLDRYDIVGL